MNEVAKAIAGAIKEEFDIDADVELTHPNEQFGDYASNVALKLAKQLNQNPRQIADTICQKLSTVKGVDSVAVAGPGFINIKISSKQIATNLQFALKNAPNGVFGASVIGKGKTVVCEFPSPNMAKPFSVGHIRSGVQGWAVAQLMQMMGYKVVTDNHLGDSGAPFGKWVVGFLRHSSDQQLKKDGIYELSRIYIKITKELQDEKTAGQATLANEVQQWLKKLEGGDKQAVLYSKRFNEISIEHMHDVLGKLGITTDYELGESYYINSAQKLVDELLKTGIATLSDGAVIVDIKDLGIDTPMLLRKANGAALYATTDLATIQYRQEKWSPAKVFIHTGQEQAFYFRQLAAVAKKSGFDDVIQHLWHGLVDQLDESGNRQKMSSRKGVILLEELLNEAHKKAAALTKDGSKDDIHAVAMAAVKFANFTSDRKNGVLFDWDSMFSVQGFSGPAVQYAAVRIGSILAKADHEAQPAKDYDWKTEHNLLRKVSDYPDLLLGLHDSYEMHHVAAYAYELAKELNRYYELVNVLKSDKNAKESRLWLLAQVRMVLVSSLDLLGIPTPDKM